MPFGPRAGPIALPAAFMRSVKAYGAKGDGVTELLTAIDAHFAYLEETGGLRERRRRRLRDRVVDVVEQRVRHRLWKNAETKRWLDSRVEEMEAGTATPFTVADELLEQSGELIAKRDSRASK